MEETAILEKTKQSDSCYLDLNQVTFQKRTLKRRYNPCRWEIPIRSRTTEHPGPERAVACRDGLAVGGPEGQGRPCILLAVRLRNAHHRVRAPSTFSASRAPTPMSTRLPSLSDRS